MDDQLELPSAHIATNKQEREDDAAGSSDEEDGGPDWTNLPTGSSSLLRPVLPKRGEKAHEPAHGGETRLQSHVLGRAREAMLSALSAQRGSSSKSLSHAIWYPSLARAHVTLARGIHFSSLGHSVPRPLPLEATQSLEDKGKPIEHKRLELLPEEALYLIERGTLACSVAYDENQAPALDNVLPPMSVQQAYADMVGTVDLTLEKYQVYAYLKRLGYAVTRANPPTPAYPVYQRSKTAVETDTPRGWLRSIIDLLLRPYTTLARSLRPKSTDWWYPISMARLRPASPASLFQALRGVAAPAGHNAPLNHASDTESPYKVFFNLYKPPTPFKKTAPPEPDFEVVVINAQTTLMPTLHELDNLFAELPVLPPPQPRKRIPHPDQARVTEQNTSDITAKAVSQAAPRTLVDRIRRALGLTVVPLTTDRPPPRPNPFVALKQGKKIIVIAVVDAGSIGFFRFGQGCFEEWPMA